MYDINKITDPSFIKNLSIQEMQVLCDDVRTFLIDSLSQTGGHVSSNLGVVELTVAMHKVFNTPEDKFIWDVGHQVYTHKILTGRAQRFNTLRQYKGLSGFPKREESPHDCWETGHASTSISAAVGMAYARDLKKENYHVVAVIGDGSLTGGMAYEALNHIGHTNRRLIVIINDNEMSISQNVGALHNIFGNLRTNASYLKTKHRVKRLLKNSVVLKRLMSRAKVRVKRFVIGESLFDAMGFKYLGPIDGHNLEELIKNLNVAKTVDKPVIIHVKTKKGKGYTYAEQDKQGIWHGVGKFNKETGSICAVRDQERISWSQHICNILIELSKHDSRVAVITPAMINGSALNDYQKLYPDRLIDVGIAEEHAVTMAGGMATQGMKPFVSIYSTFFKRAFDQVHHDIARQKLNVVFGVDRAGIVGADGETHQGIYDIPMLRPVPNLVMMMPKDAKEAGDLMYTAYQIEGPVVIRYPRGEVLKVDVNYESLQCVRVGSWSTLKAGGDAYIISMGPILDEFVGLAQQLDDELGLKVGVINARFIKPLDTKLLDELALKKVPLIVYEESAVIGGLGTAILEYYNQTKQEVDVRRLGIPDLYVQHGSVKEILEELHLSLQDVKQEIKQVINK